MRAGARGCRRSADPATTVAERRAARHDERRRGGRLRAVSVDRIAEPEAGRRDDDAGSHDDRDRRVDERANRSSRAGAGQVRFEDHRRRELVDDGFALRARDVGADQRFLHGGRRQPLVDALDAAVERAREVRDERVDVVRCDAALARPSSTDRRPRSCARSRSRAIATIAATSSRTFVRSIVSCGNANEPSGSLTATPMRRRAHVERDDAAVDRHQGANASSSARAFGRRPR